MVVLGVIALAGFVLGSPCFKHQTGGLGTCAPPPPQVSGSFKFKPRPSGGRRGGQVTGGLLGPHWGQRRSMFGSFWPKLWNVWIHFGGVMWPVVGLSAIGAPQSLRREI